jgi:RHS repeat-associated protein
MVATLARAPTNDFTTGNAKSYDVWGGARSGSSSVDQGYVANLGHRTDSESDLQYMRARYYEPGTGRFVTQDPARQSVNWYVYCGNNPIRFVDSSGGFFADVAWYWKQIGTIYNHFGVQAVITAFQVGWMLYNATLGVEAAVMAMIGLSFLSGWFGERVLGDMDQGASITAGIAVIFAQGKLALAMGKGLQGMSDVGTRCTALFMNYQLTIMMFIRLEIWREGYDD